RQCAVIAMDTVRDMALAGWTPGKGQELALAMATGAVAAALQAGADVVIDACHVAGHDHWAALAQQHDAELRVERVQTDLETCIARDSLRPPVGPDGRVSGRRVGEEVIRSLAAGRDLTLQEMAARPPRT